jgi:hypothetical protein
LSSAFQISARAFFGPGVSGLGQCREHVHGLMEPAAAIPGLGEDLPQGAPESQRTIADRQDGSAHAAAGAAAQHLPAGVALEPGDLVFFVASSSSVGHVGIYLGATLPGR